MKTKILLILFIAFNLLSCSKDGNNDDNIPFTFQVEVQNVADTAATITWTKPEGSNISYKIYLNNELIEDNFGQNAYTFTGLLSESPYNGEITATNGSQTATVSFSFNTAIYTPNIYESNAYLTNQQAVNEFGSHHYNEIRNHLIIQGSDIYDLSSLYDLKKVYGNVEIKYSSMQTFQGLENLEFIGGKLDIYRCDILENLDALENVKTINDDIEIYSNGLKDIDGLRNVENFSKGINIGSNKIVNVNIMNDATSLHHLSFADNEQLETVNGFQNVSHIEDYLDIWRNPKLISLHGLQSVNTVGDIFILDQNTDLATIDFVNLTSIGNYMSVWENQGLTNLDGFSNLSSVDGDIDIINHLSLTDLCGISTAVLNNTEKVTINGNQYNPTVQDFQNGDCRQ
jgi:hypothetical protein